MPAYVETLNYLLAMGTIAMQVVFVFVLGHLIFKRSNTNPMLMFFHKYGVYFALGIALSSVALSLFYSEVVGFAACELCWVQRFFIYPQVLILGIALWKEKKQLITLSAIVAFAGMLVSAYHIYIENGGASDLACSNYVEGSITCAARYVFEFGYITIPVMALTAQALIVLLMINHRYMSKKEIQAKFLPQ